jgi:NTE family protein
VRFEGLDRINQEYLGQLAEVQPQDTVDLTAISAEAQRMSAQRDIESVSYRLEGDPEQPALVWLPQEKRWGPDYLQFDLGLYTSVGGDLYFNLYGKHTRTWLNRLGAEWRNELQFGYENVILTSLYQPLSVSQKYFVEPRLAWWRTIEDVFDDGDRLARYSFSNYGAGLDFGVNINNQAQLRAGYLYTRRHTEVDLGSPLLPEETSTDAGLVVSATYDSRDTPFNANKGLAFALEYLQSDESLGANRDWQRIEAGLGWAVPVPLKRKDVVWLNLAGGSDLGSDLPWDRAFMIGGPGSFPGFELGEVRAEDYWLAAGSYLWKVKDIMTIRDQALYLGARLQAGQTFDRIDLIDDDVLYGASVYLTGRTPVGPLTVGVGSTSTDSWSMWLAVGRPLGHGTILERGIFR